MSLFPEASFSAVCCGAHFAAVIVTLKVKGSEDT